MLSLNSLHIQPAHQYASSSHVLHCIKKEIWVLSADKIVDPIWHGQQSILHVTMFLFFIFLMNNLWSTMYWALGSRRSLFRWFVLCFLSASRRCYLDVVDSHLLLRRSGSNWCDTAPTWVKPSVTDFTQVWVPSGSTSPLHFRAALQCGKILQKETR